MRRSPFLGALAFYPVIALAVIALLPDTQFAAPADASEFWSFWIRWWFGLFVATVVAVTIFFSVHAIRRGAVIGWRRVLWLASFWLVGPIALPVYWWVDGHAT